jgi:hypothetical protein
VGVLRVILRKRRVWLGVVGLRGGGCQCALMGQSALKRLAVVLQSGVSVLLDDSSATASRAQVKADGAQRIQHQPRGGGQYADDSSATAS